MAVRRKIARMPDDLAQRRLAFPLLLQPHGTHEPFDDGRLKRMPLTIDLGHEGQRVQACKKRSLPTARKAPVVGLRVFGAIDPEAIEKRAIPKDLSGRDVRDLADAVDAEQADRFALVAQALDITCLATPLDAVTGDRAERFAAIGRVVSDEARQARNGIDFGDGSDRERTLVLCWQNHR